VALLDRCAPTATNNCVELALAPLGREVGMSRNQSGWSSQTAHELAELSERLAELAHRREHVAEARKPAESGAPGSTGNRDASPPASNSSRERQSIVERPKVTFGCSLRRPGRPRAKRVRGRTSTAGGGARRRGSELRRCRVSPGHRVRHGLCALRTRRRDRPRSRSCAPLVRVASSRWSLRRRTTRFGRKIRWPQGQPRTPSLLAIGSARASVRHCRHTAGGVGVGGHDLEHVVVGRVLHRRGAGPPGAAPGGLQRQDEAASGASPSVVCRGAHVVSTDRARGDARCRGGAKWLGRAAHGHVRGRRLRQRSCSTWRASAMG
jgi:hypothetical protein